MTLADAGVGRLVGAEANVGGVPEQPVGRPFAEADLAHVHGLDPGRRLRVGHVCGSHATDDRTRTWRCVADDRRQQRSQLGEHVLIEARPDASRVDQRVVDVIGELQCAESAARAARLGETDDDEVARGLFLDFDPFVGAAGAVRRVGFFGDDSLEPDGRDLGEKRFALALDVVEDADRSELRHRLTQKFLPPNQRQRSQVEAVEREQIKRIIRRRQLDGGALDVDRRLQSPALLQPREARLPCGVEAHDLAVKDAVLERQRLDCTSNFRKHARVVIAVAREQLRLAVRLAGNEPIPVELELEQPAVARERRFGRLGEHRLDRRGVDLLPNGAGLLDGIAEARRRRDTGLDLFHR